jgi:hypothetical protein
LKPLVDSRQEKSLNLSICSELKKPSTPQFQIFNRSHVHNFNNSTLILRTSLAAFLFPAKPIRRASASVRPRPLGRTRRTGTGAPLVGALRLFFAFGFYTGFSLKRRFWADTNSI